MSIVVDVLAPGSIEVDVLAVPVAEPASSLSPRVAEVDSHLGGRFARLAEEGELSGEAGRVVLLHLTGELGASRVAAAGVGRADRADLDALRTAAAAVARAAQDFGGTIGWLLDDSLPVAPAEQARAIVEGTLLGAYDPARWKTASNGKRPIARLVVCADDDGTLARAAERARCVAAWTNRARDLANAPANELTPEALAAQAAEIAAGCEHLSAQALGPERLRELGMGALLAVAQGSANPARLIVLRYQPPAPSRPDLLLGLVGKAITFDSGGYSLKSAGSMEDMKADMAGGGAVVAAMGALAELGLPTRALAVVAACENMVGSAALRPGDIVTAANGKTIEVTNTDAEGRLVLADALWHARQQGATHVLDLATLTGAMELALGDLYAGLFANEQAWRDEVLAAAEASGERAWPWPPPHPRYRRLIDSTLADLKNSSSLRQASPALAAEFLREFVGEGPWAHLDMSGPAFLERSRGDYLTQRGGTGYGVRLIVELAQRLAEPVR